MVAGQPHATACCCYSPLFPVSTSADAHKRPLLCCWSCRQPGQPLCIDPAAAPTQPGALHAAAVATAGQRGAGCCLLSSCKLPCLHVCSVAAPAGSGQDAACFVSAGLRPSAGSWLPATVQRRSSKLWRVLQAGTAPSFTLCKSLAQPTPTGGRVACAPVDGRENPDRFAAR